MAVQSDRPAQTLRLKNRLPGLAGDRGHQEGDADQRDHPLDVVGAALSGCGPPDHRTAKVMLNLSDLSRIKGFRFPRSVIGAAAQAYHRFTLCLRDVEDLLASRGVRVSCETVQIWVARFGGQFAARIRRERPGSAGKWHLDEIVISNKGKKHWLWRAIDAKGDVLEILVHSRRNTSAAKRFFRKLFRRWGSRACWSRTSSAPTPLPKPRSPLCSARYAIASPPGHTVMRGLTRSTFGPTMPRIWPPENRDGESKHLGPGNLTKPAPFVYVSCDP